MDEAIARQIANPTGMAPAPGAPGVGAEAAPAPKSEAATLHELAQKAHEALKAAHGAFEELAAQAELADSVNPKLERLVTKTYDGLSKMSEGIESAVEELAEALEAEADDEAELEDDAPDEAPPL